MEGARLRQLILEHLDGRISDEGFTELQTRLAEDPRARTLYAELAQLDAQLLEIGADADAGADPIGQDPLGEAASRLSLRQWLAVAAALALILLPTMILVRQGLSRSTEPDVEPRAMATAETVRSIAVVSAEADAVWEVRGTPIGRGSALGPGRLRLASGLAQIDFFGGASITLSGPAELELVDRDCAVLHQGRVRADVPPAARGFEIRTADVRLQDLGTTFGIAAGPDGQAEIVVYDGEVRAVDRNGQFSLLTGDAAHLADGVASKLEPKALDALPDLAALMARAGGLEASHYASWRSASAERRKDPRLIAYYDFEGLSPTTRRLVNRATSGGGSDLDGGIVGARVVPGRWPDKSALDFRGVGDRVRFEIPGTFDALTLYAWVRIDALDRGLNSLFLTDHYDPGEIHWQLSRGGRLQVSTSPLGVTEDTQAENRRFFSEPFWDPAKSGQWFMVATTIDREASSPVAHYINGARVGFSGGVNMDRPLPKLRIGGADLANWTDPIAANLDAIRTLNGRIDEFAIYAAALDADEIKQIYEQGRP